MEISMSGMVWNLMLLGINMLALYSFSICHNLQKTVSSGTGFEYSSMPAHILEEVISLRETILNAQEHVLSLRNKNRNSVGRNLLVSSEFSAFTKVRPLHLAKNRYETMICPVGHACLKHKDLVDKYMNYTIGGLCPDDWDLGQALMLRGCEPLPRRRCFARTPFSYSSPLPWPQSMWSQPPDDTVRWTHYTCKSFSCLNNRARNKKVFSDCNDCFELQGLEKHRWITRRSKADMVIISEILALKQGSIRIGLDIGGGSGSFAVRMAEQNVTIITSTLNFNGPFNEFIALRGVVPLFLTISQRFPFFDNTLDIIHTMHILSNWIPKETLEFIFYDIDRILRPGGLFWLDRFFCTQDQLDFVFAPMIESLGFKKIKWLTFKKLDRNGHKHKEVYLSALLEKPIRDVGVGSEAEL